VYVYVYGKRVVYGDFREASIHVPNDARNRPSRLSVHYTLLIIQHSHPTSLLLLSCPSCSSWSSFPGHQNNSNEKYLPGSRLISSSSALIDRSIVATSSAISRSLIRLPATPCPASIRVITVAS
jgi:hypothetical protein